MPTAPTNARGAHRNDGDGDGDIFCVFAKHIKKGILRCAKSCGAIPCVMLCMQEHAPAAAVGGRFDTHHGPTTGRPIWRRTSRFAQKLRELFPLAASRIAGAMTSSGDSARSRMRRRKRPGRTWFPSSGHASGNTKSDRAPRSVPVARTLPQYPGSKGNRVTSVDRHPHARRGNKDAGAVATGRHRVLQRTTRREIATSGCPAGLSGPRLPAARRSRPDRAAR